MRIIEKTESPMNARAKTTFSNTFWEPQAKEAPMGAERVNGAVMSGQVESHAVAEEPEQAATVKRITEECEEVAPAKQIAKELFPTGEEGIAILPDLGHILVGGQNRQPASGASHGSPSRPPPLEHPIEQLCTPEKPTGTAEGEGEWEFPQTPGGLTGPVSTKLWASPSVSPLPPPQAMATIPSTDRLATAALPAEDVSPTKGHASRTPFSMRRIVMGLVILTTLLAGVALLSAYAKPLLTSAQHGQRMLQTEHDTPPGPVPPLQDDSHALAIIPARQDKTWQGELKDTAVNIMKALRGAVPLPAAKFLQLPSMQSVHASGDVSADDSAADDSAAEWHLLAHVPFAAMLAGVALSLHCLTRLTLSLMVWRCGNPCCARHGKVRRRHINGCTMCQRCGQWAARHDGHFWGAQTTRPAWARVPGGRTCMCLLRDMGLGFARED